MNYHLLDATFPALSSLVAATPVVDWPRLARLAATLALASNGVTTALDQHLPAEWLSLSEADDEKYYLLADTETDEISGDAASLFRRSRAQYGAYLALIVDDENSVKDCLYECSAALVNSDQLLSSLHQWNGDLAAGDVLKMWTF